MESQSENRSESQPTPSDHPSNHPSDRLSNRPLNRPLKCPVDHSVLVLDPTGRARDAETAELIARGPATPADILGVQTWAVSDPRPAGGTAQGPEGSPRTARGTGPTTRRWRRVGRWPCG